MTVVAQHGVKIFSTKMIKLGNKYCVVGVMRVLHIFTKASGLNIEQEINKMKFEGADGLRCRPGSP